MIRLIIKILRLMKNYIPLTLVVFLLFACNTGNAPSITNAEEATTLFSKILAPFTNLAPAIKSFSFQNKNGMVNETERGSVIIVPADAFVSEDGSLITGKVDLQFVEILTTAEILLSGIPMNVKKDKTDEVVPFISDGMFTIHAQCEGKDVKLAEGKEISVGTVSAKTEKDFDYWYFNEKSGSWENEGNRDKTLPKEEIVALAEAVNPQEAESLQTTLAPSRSENIKTAKTAPLAPEIAKETDFVFNVRADYEQYPELALYKNVLWKPIADFSAKQSKDLELQMQKTGANVSLNCIDENSQIYEITYGDKKVQARPVFIGSDKAKAIEKYKSRLNQYNAEKKQSENALNANQIAINARNATYNLFTVAKMGIYNCDRYYSYEGVKKEYTFKTKEGNVDNFVFAVLSNNQGVIALSSAYKVKDTYVLPTNEIVGFIHTNSKGEVYTNKHIPEQTVGKNDVQLTFRSSNLESTTALEEVLKTL